ncbi:MAG TPA: putative zinc-binding metallopeptidase [Steroidobacteraceae bacterium]|nr:putative zinc-binding metallopeptidase [Steroidobacteraceae bacterium]
MRFCDLKLKIERSPVARRVRRLYRELDKRQISFRPHVWLSEEWFSPDGVPGIAVPFYLAHPRLEKLERRMMRNVEGGSAESAMRILRHEAGHAIDTAYRLRRRKRWREVFGPASLPYPDTYRARPGSRRYVQHLGEWYAQSHPCEDFAETFAVWLKPNSSWRRTYAQWPAFHKLELVDELLSAVRARRPPVRNREIVEPLRENTRTLADHYRRKLRRYNMYRRTVTDHLLERVFTAERNGARRPVRASTFLRANEVSLINGTMREVPAAKYSIEQILRIAVERADKLGLWVRGSRRDATRHARWMLVYLTRLYAQGESPTLSL